MAQLRRFFVAASAAGSSLLLTHAGGVEMTRLTATELVVGAVLLFVVALAPEPSKKILNRRTAILNPSKKTPRTAYAVGAERELPALVY